MAARDPDRKIEQVWAAWRLNILVLFLKAAIRLQFHGRIIEPQGGIPERHSETMGLRSG